MGRKAEVPAVPYYTDEEIDAFMSDADIKELGHRLGYLFPGDPGYAALLKRKIEDEIND
ncbi:hypothetical protein [Schleiferilactobacillus harbinensis]|uniref:hypothetical protein n=1 Tax=Schleiferilactobacillus harbinensis TaxID=304207 RepID=UPI00345EF112